MTLAASIVVPTYRRPDLLRRCLSALLAQDVDPSDFEIVVADDAGEESALSIVLEFDAAAKTTVRYLAVGPVHGPAAARNGGWRAARGPIIAFTDDDCVPNTNWLREGLQAMQGAHAAAGRVVVPLPETPTDYEQDAAGLAHGEFVTANCFCRRSVLEQIGGFDQRFEAAWREDSDLQFTLLEHWFTIARAPNAIVVHPVRPAQWGVSLKQQRKTMFNALLFKKHPELCRQRIASVPWNYYAMTAALFFVPVGAIAKSPTLSAAAALVWLALTVEFCLRRLRGTSKSPRHIAEMFFTSAFIPPVSLFWHLRGCLRFRIAC
jgi:GT2 family glycosyltransferase